MFERRNQQYSPLSNGRFRPVSESRIPKNVLLTLCFLIWTAVVFFGGFLFGRLPIASTTSPTISKTFRYNRTFADIPSKETNEAWEQLFPPLGGFFNVSGMKEQRATLTVFHQLHCLDEVRHSYWELSHAKQLGGQPDKDQGGESGGKMHSPSHVRHCIDLLRQSLMCNADITLEYEEQNVNGVHGFGTKHQCRSWELLLLDVAHKQGM